MHEEQLKKFSHIFRSYDIRGIYKKDLDEDIMERISNCFAGIAKELVVAMDMRLSSEDLKKAFASGVTKAGKDITDLGLVPMGAAMFYAMRHDKTLAYITASHLPKEWNGVKFFHSNGEGFFDSEINEIKNLFLQEQFIESEGETLDAIELDNNEILNNYQMFLSAKLQAKKRIRVVI